MEPDKLQIYEILARQHQPMLLAYIFSFVHDAQLAEDIAQESFLIAYQKLAALRDPDGFGPWLRRIARLQILTTLRERSPEIAFEPALLDGIENVFASLEQQAPADLWPDRLQLVENCFQQLPDKLREACRLHYFEDRATQAIADFLQLSLAAVLKRLERARDSIRDCVQKQLKLELR